MHLKGLNLISLSENVNGHFEFCPPLKRMLLLTPLRAMTFYRVAKINKTTVDIPGYRASGKNLRVSESVLCTYSSCSSVCGTSY